MLNLKDAFRAQNRFQELIDSAISILNDSSNILKVSTTHFRSEVVPDDQDVVTVEAANSEYADHINELTDFLVAVLAERETLSAAIRKAKAGLPVDIDSESGLNRVRQRLSSVFHYMAVLRNSEKIISGGGTGYRFNSDGNQVSYRCDAKQVKTIQYDRNKVRSIASALSRQAEEISAQIDKCLVNTTVEYTLPFDINDSFDAVFTDFAEKHAFR